MKDAKKFLKFITEERDFFCNEINKRAWDAKLNVIAENLLIAYDQMKERLIKHTTWREASEKCQPLDGGKIIFQDAVGMYWGTFHAQGSGVVDVMNKHSDYVRWENVYCFIEYPNEPDESKRIQSEFVKCKDCKPGMGCGLLKKCLNFNHKNII